MGGQDIFVCGKMMSKPGRGRWVTARKLGGWTLGPAVSARPVSTAPSRGHPERASLEPPAPPPNWRRPGQSAQAERAGRGLPDPRGPRAALHQSRSSNEGRPSLPPRDLLGGGGLVRFGTSFPLCRKGLPRSKASTGARGRGGDAQVPCRPLSSRMQPCLQPKLPDLAFLEPNKDSFSSLKRT